MPVLILSGDLTTNAFPWLQNGADLNFIWILDTCPSNTQTALLFKQMVQKPDKMSRYLTVFVVTDWLDHSKIGLKVLNFDVPGILILTLQNYLSCTKTLYIKGWLYDPSRSKCDQSKRDSVTLLVILSSCLFCFSISLPMSWAMFFRLERTEPTTCMFSSISSSRASLVIRRM